MKFKDPMNIRAEYYDHVVNHILYKYEKEFSSVHNGYCIKITGLGREQVGVLLDKIREHYVQLDSFILSDSEIGQCFISPTKLVELRNKEGKPLLIIVPANSRTAAEDSFGNATFKNISLIGIEDEIASSLLNETPASIRPTIEEVFQFIGKIPITDKVEFLLRIKSDGWVSESVGNNLFCLGFIPDADLGQNVSKTRARLNFNSKSSAVLSDFNRTIFERLKELPLEKDTIQKSIVRFLKDADQVRSRQDLMSYVAANYPGLNFSQWPIPDLDAEHIRLYVEALKASEFQEIDGVKCLILNTTKSAKLKVRIKTIRELKTIQELAYFRVILMAANGKAGEFVQEMKKIKNTSSRLAYKDLNITIDPTIISEGGYFIKVLAEDANGVILNADDDFKDENDQRSWLQRKTEPDANKTSFEKKLTNDSEDFFLSISTEDEQPADSFRKDKLNTILEAYFKLRIEQFRQKTDPTESQPEIAQWIVDPGESTKITYNFRYDSKHDYQLNFSYKLYQIEKTFLNHASELGTVIATASNNPAQVGLSSIQFYASSVLNQLAPQEVLNARHDLLTAISESAAKSSGILFTSSIVSLSDRILTYIGAYSNWTQTLKEKLQTIQPENVDELKELNELLLELQSCDVVTLKTRLDDNQPIEAKLLSPLHPLRLGWLIDLLSLYTEWENKTIQHSQHRQEWKKELETLFLGYLHPGNNPLVLLDPTTKKGYQYAGEIAYGWGVYFHSDEVNDNSSTLTSNYRQLKSYLGNLLNIEIENQIDSELSEQLIVRHLNNYVLQHPYTDCIVINLFNAGDAVAFGNALVTIDALYTSRHLRYEVRLFKGKDDIITHGEGLRNLLNPEYNISEEAEAFSQPSANRLFPKLRFSINPIKNYLTNPGEFSANVSFLISPFPTRVELYKPKGNHVSFYLNGVITAPVVEVTENGTEIQWNKFVFPNETGNFQSDITIKTFQNLQSFIAASLASKYTNALPATSLILKDADKVLINNVHDYSDWVITFDRNLGPEIYDLPGKAGDIPFLLDYVPGEEVTGISSYLTTRPTSEIIGLLGPHFQEYNIPFDQEGPNPTLQMLLEDLRAISSSLIMQLTSARNKAFEVVGAAFTKRVLEKKGILDQAFLIPIDLHQNLFEGLSSDSRSRADHLLATIDAEKRVIDFVVIEVKCRAKLTSLDAENLKLKMKEQMDNTILALSSHFAPDQNSLSDRLDRTLKNRELKSLLDFYIHRAHRYGHLNRNSCERYLDFINSLDEGFSLKFKELGIIFDFQSPQRHKKEQHDETLTYFTFGGSLIKEIIDPESDLNTTRLEHIQGDENFVEYFGTRKPISTFIQKFISDKNKTKEPSISYVPTLNENTKLVQSVAETEVEVIKDGDGLVPATNIPSYDVLVGDNEESSQYGILGRTVQGKVVALDANKTNTISLFGVQGGGKSYTIGIITEMMLKQFDNINKLPSPLAGVLFHYSDTVDYAPEATSMAFPNDTVSELAALKSRYGAEPDRLDDIVLLVPADKLDERRYQYPNVTVNKISFNSNALAVQDWMFLLGAVGNDATYIRQLKAIMREIRNNLTIGELRSRIDSSSLLSNTQRSLAQQRLNFAAQYIDDTYSLKEHLLPGRLIIIDSRDEFIEKDEALGLFVIVMNIFSNVREIKGKAFNKFMVFDEAHKYMNNRDLTGSIVTSIREMRHKGVSIMIASQDPPSLPNEIIELSSIVIMHKFNSPQWLKHIQKSITPASELNAVDLSSLAPGEAFIWSTKSTDKVITQRPVKIFTRARVTKHGGNTVEAI